MDGIYELRKRSATRLWYRQMPDQPAGLVDPRLAELIADLLAEPTVGALPIDDVLVAAAPVALDLPKPEPRDATQAANAARARVAETAPLSAASVPHPTPSDGWDAVPSSAPSLLLSTTALLDARLTGLVLGPGARYRVVGIQNGVACLDVAATEGGARRGYCAAVDLAAVDAKFASLRGTRTLGASAALFRGRVQRLTDHLSQATTSFLG